MILRPPVESVVRQCIPSLRGDYCVPSVNGKVIRNPFSEVLCDIAFPQCKVYLVEDVLMNFLLGILEGGGSVDEHPLIQQLLDLFWLLMEVRSSVPSGSSNCFSHVIERPLRNVKSTASSFIPHYIVLLYS